jgi:hypothetical protein
MRQNPKFTNYSHNPKLLKPADCKISFYKETIFVSHRQYNSVASQDSVSCFSARSGHSLLPVFVPNSVAFPERKIAGFIHTGDKSFVQ